MPRFLRSGSQQGSRRPIGLRSRASDRAGGRRGGAGVKSTSQGAHRAATALVVALLCVGAFAATAGSVAGAQASPTGEIHRAERPIPGQYIVTLRDENPDTTAERANSLAAQYHGAVSRVYEHALQGFAVRMNEQQAAALAADPEV